MLLLSGTGKKYTSGPRYWNVRVLVNTGTFLVYQYCLKMWYLCSQECVGVIQKLTILECKNGLVLSNTRVPVSGTWSLLFPCYPQLSPKVVILRLKRSKFSWKVTAHYGLWGKTDWHPINENLYWWMEVVPKIGKENSQIRNPNQITLCNFLRRYAGIICIYFCCCKLNVKSVFLLLGVLVLWRSAHFRICLHPSISPFPSLSISTFLKVKTFNIMEK